MRRLLPLPLLLLVACTTNSNLDDVPPTLAYAPVYAAVDKDAPLEMLAAKPTITAGKIYAYGAYAFQVDQYNGIHIIGNAHSREAKKIGFLQVPLCTEIAIRNNYLYTNNNDDIVVFDLTNPQAPKLVKRIENAFPALNIQQDYPPFSNVYFECPDPAKGMVVNWVQKPIENPQCRR